VATGRQGQGPATAYKERTFGSALSVGLRIFKSRLATSGFEYVHADLHAGSGYNHERGCEGSPVVFHRLASGAGVLFRAFYCDNDPTKTLALEETDAGRCVRSDVICSDNASALCTVWEYILATQPRPDMAVGSVIIDPNGYITDAAVPSATLKDFARQFPRMDLIFNLNMTHYRQVRGLERKGAKPGGLTYLPEPSKLPQEFARQFGLIQIREPVDGNKFMTLVLRNVKTGSHQRLGLFDIHSEIGGNMLKECRYAGQIPLRF